MLRLAHFLTVRLVRFVRFVRLRSGGFGYDFSFDEDKTEEAVSTVARGLLAHGVTSFLPTVITSAPQTYRKVSPE